MKPLGQTVLRAVLLLSGVAITLLGIDNAMGGIATLGWQGPTDFFAVTDAQAFAIRDNHLRFISGIWLGTGLVFCLASVWLVRLRVAVATLCGLIVVGAIMRFTQGDIGLLLRSDLLPSVMMELLLFPALGLWVLATGREPSAA